MPYLGELIFCESFCSSRDSSLSLRVTLSCGILGETEVVRSFPLNTVCNTFDCFFPRRRMKLAVIQELKDVVFTAKSADQLSGMS